MTAILNDKYINVYVGESVIAKIKETSLVNSADICSLEREHKFRPYPQEFEVVSLADIDIYREYEAMIGKVVTIRHGEHPNWIIKDKDFIVKNVIIGCAMGDMFKMKIIFIEYQQ